MTHTTCLYIIIEWLISALFIWRYSYSASQRHKVIVAIQKIWKGTGGSIDCQGLFVHLHLWEFMGGQKCPSGSICCSSLHWLASLRWKGAYPMWRLWSAFAKLCNIWLAERVSWAVSWVVALELAIYVLNLE